MLTVSEISRYSNVTSDTVRHYVRIGLLNPQRNQSNGYKEFTDKDINIVKFICQARGLGFSLQDISTILHHRQKGKSPCPIVRNIIQIRIGENRLKLQALIKLQQHMEDALQSWEKMPDGIPNGYAICHLIEST
ncbi:MAG: MerR family transcriptional regulator [Thiohalomonadales bacterium]